MSLGVRPMGFYCLPHFALLQLGVLFQRCMKKAARIPMRNHPMHVPSICTGIESRETMRLSDDSMCSVMQLHSFVDQPFDSRPSSLDKGKATLLTSQKTTRGFTPIDKRKSTVCIRTGYTYNSVQVAPRIHR